MKRKKKRQLLEAFDFNDESREIPLIRKYRS